MSAPPGAAPVQKPTGGHVSENAANAAAAIRRAGEIPTPRMIRVVLRASRDAADEPTSAEDFGWWDRLVRSVPLGVRPARAQRFGGEQRLRQAMAR